MLKASTCWLACGLLLAAPVALAAQTLARASSTLPPPGSALPPPGLNDPGAVPLPSTGIPPSVAPAARNGGRDSTNVASHTNSSGDTIEEYSRGGHVYMVKVTPKHGVTQTYRVNDNADGSLGDHPHSGGVAPVYYDLYKWGGPKKAAPASARSGG